MRSKNRFVHWASLLLAIAMFAAACGSDGDGNTTASNVDGAGDVEPADVSGEIFISGSSTVEPVTVRVAELFEEVAPEVFVDVKGPGTGDGFAVFCEGETDISGASRAIKPAEIENCEAAGISYIELQVGIDGLGVLTNAANTAVECVSFADLYALTGPESSGFSSWADANALSLELGGTGSLPDAPLDVFGPGEESGTYDTYVEFVVEEFNEDRGADGATRPDYNASADDNIILQGIQSSDTSLGWVGFAFATNASGVSLIEVDDGAGCVEANVDTIASGEYPLSRPLYIYINADKAAADPALAAYVDFFMSEGLDIAVSEVGYVALTEEAKAASREMWDGR